MKKIALTSLTLITLILSSFQDSIDLTDGLYFDSFNRFIRKYNIQKCFIHEYVPVGLKKKFAEIDIIVVDTTTIKHQIKDSIFGVNVLFVYPVELINGDVRVKYEYCKAEVFKGSVIYSTMYYFYYTYTYNDKEAKYLFKKYEEREIRY